MSQIQPGALAEARAIFARVKRGNLDAGAARREIFDGLQSEQTYSSHLFRTKVLSYFDYLCGRPVKVIDESEVLTPQEASIADYIMELHERERRRERAKR